MKEEVKSVKFDDERNYTLESLKHNLRNYIKIQDPKELADVPVETWVKYVNKKTKLYRTGGVLIVNKSPVYIMLKNPYKNNITWSVNVAENVFFVLDKEKQAKEKKEKSELHRLYKEGKLELRK